MGLASLGLAASLVWGSKTVSCRLGLLVFALPEDLTAGPGWASIARCPGAGEVWAQNSPTNLSTSPLGRVPRTSQGPCAASGSGLSSHPEGGSLGARGQVSPWGGGLCKHQILVVTLGSLQESGHT